MARLSITSDSTHASDKWPGFLDLLDSEPGKALDEFYRLASGTIARVPPRPVRGLAKQAFEDFFHDFVLACCKGRFRKLKQYRDRGRPFAGWLYVVAHNFALDWLARLDQPMENTNFAETAGVSGNGLAHLVQNVQQAISTLSEKCRLLLKLAAEEYTPKEMTLAMGWPEDQNAKASNDLRYCRRKLRQILADSGVDIEEELGSE